MSLRVLARRRPSAALVVSFLALFVALGGAGWAALRIPPKSVGTVQLQNFSVGNAKLKPNSVGPGKIIAGAVGARQVNSSQVQLRVTGPCTVGAIQSIAVSGNVTCTQVLPNEYGTTASTTPVGTGTASTLVAMEQLAGSPGGSNYLVLGNIHWTVSGTPTGPQSVRLECTLQVESAATSGESIAELDTSQTAQAGTIPMVLPASILATHGMAVIACGFTATPATPAPNVTAVATINAIQTASNS
jgi:hypothetical protein